MNDPVNHEEIRRQLREINAVYQETDALYGRLAAKSGLSDCAFWLMYSIREAGGEYTQREFCSQWPTSKQTVNSALKGLERRGYITLTSSQSDKRSKYLVLTPEGVRFAQENIDVVFELEQLAFRQMDPAERAGMVSAARKYQELFQKEAERLLK